MASLDSLNMRALAASTMSGRVVDDKSLAIEIVYVPQATGDTPVVTLVSGTGITLADSLTTTGSLAFGVYTNLGLLVDKINTYIRWKARIIDGLRATSTASSVLLPNSAITAVSRGGESIYEVLIDQDVNDSVFYRVSADRGVLRDDDGRLKDQIAQDSHRVKITGITYNQNISAATLNGIRIYEFDYKTLSETQVWSAKSVDATATTHDFTLNPITATEGNDLVVMINDSAITDDVANFLQVDYIRE